MSATFTTPDSTAYCGKEQITSAHLARRHWPTC